MRVLVILLALLVVPRTAAADPAVGVLVTGDYLKGPTQQQAEKWLRGNAKKVITNPMPNDAVATLLNCFVLDDQKCMRSIVEARATTPILVSIRIDVASKKAKEIRLTIDWFVKGHSPVSARRTCDKCTEDTLRTTLDLILEDLAKIAPGFTAKVKITSKEAGITILLDGATIGVTPLEREVTVGSHKVRLVRDGRMGPERTIEVQSGTVGEVVLDAPPEGPAIGDVPPRPPPHRRSRLVPGLMIGLGVAGIGAGTALYLTSEKPMEDQRYYRDSRPLGIGAAVGGGALLITGVIIILATKSTTTPTVSMTPGGDISVGWAGRF